MTTMRCSRCGERVTPADATPIAGKWYCDPPGCTGDTCYTIEVRERVEATR